MGLYIIGMGSDCYDVVSESGGDMLKRLEAPHPFDTETVIPEAFIYLNNRMNQTKLNRLMCYGLWKASGLSNILLIAPNSSIIDKRVRNLATIFDLPPRAGGGK